MSAGWNTIRSRWIELIPENQEQMDRSISHQPASVCLCGDTVHFQMQRPRENRHKQNHSHTDLFIFIWLCVTINNYSSLSSISKNTQHCCSPVTRKISPSYSPVNCKSEKVTAAINKNNYTLCSWLTLQYLIKSNEWQHFTALQLICTYREGDLSSCHITEILTYQIKDEDTVSTLAAVLSVFFYIFQHENICIYL